MIRELGSALCAAGLSMFVLSPLAVALPLGPEPILFSTAGPNAGGSPADIMTPAGGMPINMPTGAAPVIAVSETAPGVPLGAELALPFPGFNVNAFSRGFDMLNLAQPALNGVLPDKQYNYLFSVDGLAVGAPGTPVESEAGGPGASADVFGSKIVVDGGGSVFNLSPTVNELTYDADGSLLLPSMGLSEAEDIDAIDVSPRGDPHEQDLLGTKFFSLDLATAPGGGFAAADVVKTPAGGVPTVFASMSALGLVPNDDIDALALAENGDGVYDAAMAIFDWVGLGSDMLLFSLAPDSPSLVTYGVTPGDILVSLDPDGTGPAPAVVVPFISHADLGLMPEDNLNALDVVPEPSTYAMALLSLAGLGFMAYRRKKS